MQIQSVIALLTVCTVLSSCGGASDSAVEGPDAGDSLNDPLSDPGEGASQGTFFGTSFIRVRTAGSNALTGYGVETYLLQAMDLIPEGALVDQQDVDVACADLGGMRVGQTTSIEPNTETTVLKLEFGSCQEDGVVYSGELTQTTVNIGIHSAGQVTTTQSFELSVDGVENNAESLMLVGSITDELLTQFATPEGCPSVNTREKTYTILDGSYIDNPVASINAVYQWLDFTVRSTDRLVNIDTACEAVEFVSFQGSATGQFDRIADSVVTVSKSGVVADSGIADTDEPAQLKIFTADEKNTFSILATGESPTSVQIDIVEDAVSVQSYSATWDFES